MIYFLVVGWFALGFIAYCSCLAEFYDIETRYPLLGTADHLWNKDGRRLVLPLAVFMSLAGPVGFLTAVCASHFFRHGFRIW